MALTKLRRRRNQMRQRPRQSAPTWSCRVRWCRCCALSRPPSSAATGPRAQLAAALGDHPRETVTLQHLLAEVCTEPEPEPELKPAHKLEDGHDVVPLARSLAEWLTGTVAVVASRVCGDAALRHSMLSLLGTGSDSGGGSYRQHWHKVRLQSSDRAAMHTFLL